VRGEGHAIRLQTLAPAKINVCLLLGPVREQDGRHELVTVVQSIALSDRVVLQVASGPVDTVHCPGVDERDNLATAALALFRKHFGWRGEPVAITIDKRVPVAGGMAGGSADAGAVLRLLHRHSGLGALDELEEIAIELGADVPSQIRPGRVLATGAGEQLERVPGVSGYGVVIVPAELGLSTAAVYREADRLGLARDRSELSAGLDQVRAALPDLPDELCVNELQPATLSLRPELRQTLDRLESEGADVALVSGSGPTVVGLFRDTERAASVAESIDGALLAKPVGHDAGEVT